VHPDPIVRAHLSLSTLHIRHQRRKGRLLETHVCLASRALTLRELKALGLRERDFKIIVANIRGLITLIEAREVAEILSKEENVKSAVLLSPGFHTRRSYLIYRHVCGPFQIKIFPSACFNSYQLDHWWSQENGLRDFTAELVKLAYYLAGGYIPLKLSY
jgi:hypothetical protein